MMPIFTPSCFCKPLLLFAALFFLPFLMDKSNAQCDLHVTLTFQPNPYCLGDKVTFVANVTGGKQPYSYEWGPWPNGNPTWSIDSFLVLNMDTIYWFNVWVTDEQGCTATAHYKATPPFLTADIEIQPGGCDPENQYELVVQPAHPDYAY